MMESLQKLKRLNFLQKERLNYLQQEMRVRDVTFDYLTVKGEVRTALGTLQPSKLPPLKGFSKDKRNDAIFVYWDVEQVGWRSFRKDNLLCVDWYEEED